jgi:hypothetical protein
MSNNHSDDSIVVVANHNNDDDGDDVARMESEIVSLESEMVDLDVEIQTIQLENSAAKKEIENLLLTPSNSSMGAIELGMLGLELLALKVYLTDLVREETDCKNRLKERTDQVLDTAYRLHALLKRQLATRRQELAEAQARLQRVSLRVSAAAE